MGLSSSRGWHLSLNLAPDVVTVGERHQEHKKKHGKIVWRWCLLVVFQHGWRCARAHWVTWTPPSHTTVQTPSPEPNHTTTHQTPRTAHCTPFISHHIPDASTKAQRNQCGSRSQIEGKFLPPCVPMVPKTPRANRMTGAVRSRWHPRIVSRRVLGSHEGAGPSVEDTTRLEVPMRRTKVIKVMTLTAGDTKNCRAKV